MSGPIGPLTAFTELSTQQALETHSALFTQQAPLDRATGVRTVVSAAVHDAL